VLGLILGSTFQEVMDFVISGAMLTKAKACKVARQE
jgi:hypothetical protein